MNQKRLDQLFEMLKDNPSDSFLLYAIAMEYNNAGQARQALEYYEKLVSEHENYVGTYYHLAKLYEQMGLSDRAEATYEKGLVVTRKAGDNHAFNELRSAYNSFKGLDEDDE